MATNNALNVNAITPLRPTFGGTGFTSSGAPARYVVSDTPNAAYSTIQSAINAAVAGGASLANPENVLILSGTYTENITLSPHVYLSCVSIGDVSITGTITFAAPLATDSSGIININVTQTDGINPVISCSGSGSLSIQNSLLVCGGGSNLIESANTISVYIDNSLIAVDTGSAMFDCAGGSLFMTNSISSNLDTGSTLDGASLTVVSTVWSDWIALNNAASLTVISSTLSSGANSSITIDATSSASVLNTVIASDTGGFAISGTGVLDYAALSFTGSNSLIAPTLTATGGQFIPGAVLAPQYGGTGLNNSFGLSITGPSAINQDVTTTSVPHFVNTVNQTLDVTTASGTTALNSGTPQTLNITGPDPETFVLPDATTLQNGHSYKFINNANSVIDIQDFTTGAVLTQYSSSTVIVQLLDNSTAAGSWIWNYLVPEGITFSELVLQASNTIATFDAVLSSTLIQATQGNVLAGNQVGGAGSLISYAPSDNAGSLSLTSIDSAGDYANVISNASTGQATTWTIPDPGAATGTFMLSALSTPDNASNLIAFDITVTAAALATGGTVTLQLSSGSKQYKIRELYLNGNGTNFSGGGGDRAATISDGVTAYSVISPANLQTLANSSWGSANLPFPAAAALNTSTAAGASLTIAYSGGTTDYAAGSMVISGVMQRVA